MTELSKQASKIMKKMAMGLSYIVVHLTLIVCFISLQEVGVELKSLIANMILFVNICNLLKFFLDSYVLYYII
jgi:hypothetical protein